ncbi:3-keto-disaccharide hydrolase [Pelagicoccus albus]|uniref:DUF1080 domain-containing protein n=1 Tax=Pelagicoccus albus TaxID=415222 RepID=A0A7X1EBR9_9BACT|nr:DUF1080 domain-containing protein [Pelagicoccus albus]MBC2608107.1 DUF1080 domain-containing protein [Pelagicoccus albus]
MIKSPRLLFQILLSIFFSSYAEVGAAGQEIDLFNGKDLSGWKIVVEEGAEVDGASLFAVSEGVIHVYPNSEDGSQQPFAGIFTEESYENYRLTVEYRWGDDRFAPRADSVRDAGIIFHMVGEPVIWPTGIECQIQEGDTGDIWIVGQTRASSYVQPIAFNYDPRGDLLTRGVDRNPQRFPRGYCREKEGWNRIELIVEGDHATYIVNGHIVNEAIHMRYREDESEWSWMPLDRGRIFLQAEGAEVFYRNIRLQSLD